MHTYAYLRVSTLDQKINRQFDSISHLNLSSDAIYIDTLSGKNFERTAWQALIRRLQPGDVLFVHSIDRLGRNYTEILEWWRVLTKEKGIDIVVLDMPLLDTRKNKDLLGTFLADLVLGLLSYVAENERETLRKRQAEGIASAKARGVHMGRPPKKLPVHFEQVAKDWAKGKLTLAQALTATSVPKTTFYKYARTYRLSKGT